MLPEKPMRALFLRLPSIILFLLMLSGCATTNTTATNFGERPEVQRFIQRVSVKDGFSQSHLTDLFNQVHVRPVVIHHTRAPHETVFRWDKYRAIFIEQPRIIEGADFWHQHQDTLTQAEETYGVSPAIIIAIIGVETRYGQFLGKYRVMDSLSTLSFDYPKRQAFFQNELEQYLLLTRELNLNPLDLYGSYAGAVGLPQFMPDSYRKLAVSATNGQPADLWHHPKDAILSVANFFRNKGWVPYGPIAVRARINGNRYQQLDFSGFQPRYTLGQLAHYGIHAETPLPLPLNTPANLLILPTSNGAEYWLAFHNFYVITRYNTSIYYAMAVYELSDAITQTAQGSQQ